MNRRRLFHLTAAFLLFVLLLSGCLTACGRKETAVTMSVLDLPEDLDPQTTTDPAAEGILINVMEGLTRRNAAGKAVPAAAESIQVSEDQLTWRFHLKDSAWSDGTPVQPEDFVFAIQRLFDPATDAKEDAKAFLALKNAEDVLDGKLPFGNIGVWAEGKDVVFSLERPEPELPLLLSSMRAMPCRKEFFAETAGSYGLGRKELLYNGPYVIRYWLENEYIILGVNGHHAGETPVNRQVSLNLVSSQEEAVSLFREGKTNLCFGRKNQFDRQKERDFHTMLFEDQVFCLAAQTASGPLKNQALREALMRALNREAIPEENTGGYIRATGILPAALTARPTEHLTEYDPEKARALLAEYLKKEGLEKPGALTITMPEEGYHREMLALLQQSWQTQLGLYVNLEILPQEEWEAAWQSGDYELAILPVAAEADDAAAVLSEFLSGGAYQSFGFESKRFAQSLKKAQKASGTERQQLLSSCCEELHGSLAITPLYSAQGACSYAAELEGIEISPFGRQIYFASAGREKKA